MGTIAAKTKDHPEIVSVEYDLPESLEGLTEKFGAEAVASAARDSLTISIQALIRRNINKSQAEVQASVDEWKPGVRSAATQKTAGEKALGLLPKLTEEDRAELLRRLQAGEL